MSYKNLRAEMARNGITIRMIANFLEVRFATVSDKLNGRSRFFCDEAIKIKRKFFPNHTVEYLFDQDETEISNQEEEGLLNAKIS